MVLPVLLILLLTLFDFSRGFVAYISVVDGARDGARVAMQVDNSCNNDDAKPAAEGAASPYDVSVQVGWDPGERSCTVTVSYDYTSVLPFISGSFSLPGIGTVGPLWDGNMTATAVSFK